MPLLLQIALGGALGASLRHLIGTQVARLAGTAFPWGTLAVNVLGCLAMGARRRADAAPGPGPSTGWRRS